MLAIVALLVFFTLGYLFIKFYPRDKQQSGFIDTASGDRYSYEVGDGLEGDHNIFSGIQVFLPKTLPHLYLDSHKDSKISGPMLTYNNAQQVRLEGNFDKYFQLFAPKGYDSLALSIITPDVMQTLISTSQKYDVEITSHRLNIISKKKVKLNQRLLRELLKAATQLTEEVNFKFKSWSSADAQQAASARLTYYDEQAVRIFGQYYGVIRFSVAVSFLVGLILYILAFHFWHQESAQPGVLIGFAALAFPGVPIMLLYMKHTQKY